MRNVIDIDAHGSLRLGEKFIAEYRRRPVRWGFGALSWVTYQRTYSRDGEAWWQTCRRVIEGLFSVQRIHCREQQIAWDAAAAQGLAEEAYRRLFDFKWTPPGRGLWIMGTRFMYERGGAALNNCGFVSTKDLAADYCAPFLWMFRMSMLGVGVGFDTRGRGRRVLQPAPRGTGPHVIEDSREGWAAALARCLGAYVGQAELPARWDFSRIRPAGSRLRSFGGYASGPGPLQELLASLEALYDGYAGRTVDSTLIVDTMNLIGRCVVAGGIRRSAQIAFGEPGDAQFLDLKQDRRKSRRTAGRRIIPSWRGRAWTTRRRRGAARPTASRAISGSKTRAPTAACATRPTAAMRRPRAATPAWSRRSGTASCAASRKPIRRTTTASPTTCRPCSSPTSTPKPSR